MDDFDTLIEIESSNLKETVYYLKSVSFGVSELSIYRLLVPAEVFELETMPRQPNTSNIFQKERAIKRKRTGECINI